MYEVLAWWYTVHDNVKGLVQKSVYNAWNGELAL